VPLTWVRVPAIGKKSWQIITRRILWMPIPLSAAKAPATPGQGNGMRKITPDQIKTIADRHRDYAVKFLARIIQTPSFSAREEDLARLLAREFRTIGADEVQIDGLGNVLARLGNRGPVIAFDAHMDTVEVGQKSAWTTDPFSGETKKARIYGRGAADQKGGLAALVTALRILKELSDDFPFTLFFVASVQEEDCEGISWQYIINEDVIRPDIVILTEPTDGRINRGQRGRMEMEITVEGVSCHGSTPELGENAVYKIMPIISALQALADDLPTDPFLGKGSLAVTRIRSGAPSLNALPDMAAAFIDRRLTGGETPEAARSEIERLQEFQTAGARVDIPAYEIPGWRGTTYPTLKTFPAWVLRENHHLIEYARRCHDRLFLAVPQIGKWSFSTNGVATMGIFDIPTFGYGPGEEKMAHAPNESVAIDDVIKAAAFYAYFPWIVTGG
jgi:putative selenium metabolism hydrolase